MFRAELEQVGTSELMIRQLETGIVTCFEDQSAASEPGELQPSCRALLGTAAQGGGPEVAVITTIVSDLTSRD